MSKMRGQKRQLEKARQERAAAKRDRRQGRGASTAGDGESDDVDDAAREALPEDVVLARLAELHERYADGGMSLDDFEASRAELLAHLRVD